MTRNTVLAATPSAKTVVAVDLGSNSFHLLVAQCADGVATPLHRCGVKVQLLAGKQGGLLHDAAIQRGLDCIADFVDILEEVPYDACRVVGTSALRDAQNAAKFLHPAEELLGEPIEVIDGLQEAELIYAGVISTSKDVQPRLVIDVGGGSTETIVGEGETITAAHSVNVGCVALMDRYFVNGVITRPSFDAAVDYAVEKFAPIAHEFRQLNWSQAVGCSGTLQAVAQVLSCFGGTVNQIEREGLRHIQDLLLRHQHIGDVCFDGLQESRRSVFASGLAIVVALFNAFDLPSIAISKGALREGVVYRLSQQLQVS